MNGGVMGKHIWWLVSPLSEEIKTLDNSEFELKSWMLIFPLGALTFLIAAMYGFRL